MSILDRFDPVFTECLGCLCPPPYPFAICVAQTIDEATIKAKDLADRLYRMTFKEQIATDLQAIMAADEVSEDVVYTTRSCNSSNIKAVINNSGENNLDFTDGIATNSTAVIAKSSLSSAPKHNDSITDSSNKVWIVKGVVGESFSSWTLSLIGDVRIK